MNHLKISGTVISAGVLILILFINCQRGDKNSALIKAEYPESFSLSLQNIINHERKDAPVFLEIETLRKKHPDFNPEYFIILHGKNEIASQADDTNGDGQLDRITLVADFRPGETRSITIRYTPSGKKVRRYPGRTQAEISRKVGGRFEGKKYIGGEYQNVQFVHVPHEHTDHDTYFRYEGPGWESDKIGYRLFLDWRNSIDIFGKKVPYMVLQNVGLDGFDSYHEMADWGMDIFNVGKSLGVGSIGIWYDEKVYRISQTDSIICEIVANGPVRSQIRITYFGWKIDSETYNLTSNLSITAGSRLTQHMVKISGNPRNICTGLAKHEGSEVLRPANEMDGEWQYFGLYGNQSLAGDKLGTAILYRKSDLIKITEDDLSHIVILEPKNGKLTYYFLAAWEQEPDGIQTLDEFYQYLNRKILELENDINVVL